MFMIVFEDMTLLLVQTSPLMSMMASGFRNSDALPTNSWS